MNNKNIDDFDPKLDELLRLPRFSPSADFSDRVMSQVAGFQQRSHVQAAAPVPAVRRPVAAPVRPEWAIPPAISRWIPASRPARYAAGALAAMTSFATTAAAIVVAGNFGLASFVGSLALDRLMLGMTGIGAEAVNGAMGFMNAGAPAQSALVIGGLAAGGIAALVGLNKAASLNPQKI